MIPTERDALLSTQNLNQSMMSGEDTAFETSDLSKQELRVQWDWFAYTGAEKKGGQAAINEGKGLVVPVSQEYF